MLKVGKGIVHFCLRFLCHNPVNYIKIELKLSKRMNWGLALIWLNLALIQSEYSKFDLGQLFMRMLINRISTIYITCSYKLFKFNIKVLLYLVKGIFIPFQHLATFTDITKNTWKLYSLFLFFAQHA